MEKQQIVYHNKFGRGIVSEYSAPFTDETFGFRWGAYMWVIFDDGTHEKPHYEWCVPEDVGYASA